MKIKVREATELQLNWLVAKCEKLKNIKIIIENANDPRFKIRICILANGLYRYYSTNWAQGGTIIEREMAAKHGRMYLKNETYATQTVSTFSAGYTGHNWEQTRKMYGPTPLIAAMRCYVAFKLGDEVEIPKELK